MCVETFIISLEIISDRHVSKSHLGIIGSRAKIPPEDLDI